MTLPRDLAVSRLFDTPLPTRGSTVIELTREGGGWIAWLVDMDVPENTRSLGPFRGRREARRAAQEALKGAVVLPVGRPGHARKTTGRVRDPRELLDAVGQKIGAVRTRPA